MIWGPQANIGIGSYTLAHIYLDQSCGYFFVVVMLAAVHGACPVGVHANCSCTCYNGILSFTFTFTFIHLEDTFIILCCRPQNSN